MPLCPDCYGALEALGEDATDEAVRSELDALDVNQLVDEGA